MFDIKEFIAEFILAMLFIVLAIASFFWIKNNGVTDSTSIMALATIVYAFFTAFLFWNNKSSSQAQLRPFLYTKLQNNLDLKIYNRLEKNVAKNVKVRIKAIKMEKDVRKSKKLYFIHNYLWKIAYNPIWNYFESFKEYFDVMEDNKSPSLIRYLETKFPIEEKGDEYEGFSINAKTKKGKVNLKLLVHISYESLLSVKYKLDDIYYVFIDGSNIEVKKAPN